ETQKYRLFQRTFCWAKNGCAGSSPGLLSEASAYSQDLLIQGIVYMIMISGNYLVDILSPWFVQVMPLSVQGTNGTVCLLVSHQSLPVDFQQALPTHYTVSIFPQRSGIVPLYSIRESAGDSTASVLVQTVQSSASTCVLQS
ncbi:unnamed protein product, partial [Sphacelaria rigidula]